MTYPIAGAVRVPLGVTLVGQLQQPPPSLQLLIPDQSLDVDSDATCPCSCHPVSDGQNLGRRQPVGYRRNTHAPQRIYVY
jgi:hypothetical protein